MFPFPRHFPAAITLIARTDRTTYPETPIGGGGGGGGGGWRRGEGQTQISPSELND